MESIGISHRDLEVFALVTEGYNNKEVAEVIEYIRKSPKMRRNRTSSSLFLTFEEVPLHQFVKGLKPL